MARKATFLTAFTLSLVPLGQPLLLGTLGIATATSAVVLHEGAAVAQDSSAVASIAKAITVRVEGSTQGSGVIVKREGNSYTVLTAWHVVSGNRTGEEVGIYTPDGKQHRLDQGSVQRLGQVDMAVLTFNTAGTYDVASIGDVKNVSSGNRIFVSGFPLPTSSVPTSIWRFLKGDVIANANVAIPDGYQLLYSNPTLPGMSGGSVLNSQGQLVGIHGRSERDDQVSMRTGKAVSTGTNQAVPISYYRQFNFGRAVVASRSKALNFDDYIVYANLAMHQSSYAEAMYFARKANKLKPSDLGYQIMAWSLLHDKSTKEGSNESQSNARSAVIYSQQSLALRPTNYMSYFTLCYAYFKLGGRMSTRAQFDQLARKACQKSIEHNPKLATHDKNILEYAMNLIKSL